MKIILFSLCALIGLGFTYIHAQTPSAFKYQAVARTDNGSLITNKSLNFRISILTQINGPSIYIETHSSTSNAYGLVNLDIGKGVTSGNFAAINWSVGTLFIMIELDTDGTGQYKTLGTTQLLSVPFAKFSDVAGKANSVEYSRIIGQPNWSDSLALYSIEPPTSGHYVGEFYGGGIVFYTYDNGLHGFICSLTDIDDGTGAPFGNVAATTSTYDGRVNTEDLVLENSDPNCAAQLCSNYSASGFGDWYLPSLDEVNLMMQARVVINRKLQDDSNPSTIPIRPLSYWTSTRGFIASGLSGPYCYDNNSGVLIPAIRGAQLKYRVRAVRRF